ncbi:MAG: Rieske 2Fe-2S domain-containing protein, partial [Myxococcales bacterium]|nr:Rieske 2Fe-2S domain-containing protein [Myxococcales bacterium]
MQNRYYTPGIPIGWFQVEYTDQLKAGDVKPLKYFGKDLVLYRTESGEAVMLDAFCPHLGAHLGHGGKVKGENIECPFHAWQFA